VQLYDYEFHGLTKAIGIETSTIVVAFAIARDRTFLVLNSSNLRRDEVDTKITKD